MPNDGSEAEEEDETVQLKCLDRYSGCALTLEGLDIKYTKAKHACHSTVGHKERKVTPGKEEIHEEGHREEASPNKHIFVE